MKGAREEEMTELLKTQYEHSLVDGSIVSAFRMCCMFPLWPPKDKTFQERVGTAMGKKTTPGNEIVVLLKGKKGTVEIFFVGHKSVVDKAVKNWSKRKCIDTPEQAIASVKSGKKRSKDDHLDLYADEVDPDWDMTS